MKKGAFMVVGLTAIAAVFYLATLAPTVLWGDDAYFQRSAFDGSLSPDGGGHPLWLALALVFARLPLGDIAYRANLLSAAAGVLAVVGVYWIARELGVSRAGAALAALSLAVAHTFWMHSVRAEVYTLFLACLALELLLLLRWTEGRPGPLLAALGLFGLALLAHQMALLLLPALGYLLWRQRAWLTARQRALALLAFLVGLVPALAVIQWQVHGPTLLDSLRLYFTHSGVDFSHKLFDFSLPALPRDAALWLGFLALQFPGPALLLGALAWISLPRWRRSPAWQALALLYLTCTAFAFSYHVNDQYAFYLPGYLVFAPFTGLGWDLAGEKFPRLRQRPGPALGLGLAVLLPPLAYAVLAGGLAGLELNPLGIRQLPGREPNWFFLWPAKNGYHGAEQYGLEILATLPPGSLLLADHTPYQTLRYLQVVRGLRPDVRLLKIEPGDDLSLLLAAFPPDTPVFLPDDDPRYFNLAGLPGARLEPAGLVFRLVSHR